MVALKDEVPQVVNENNVPSQIDNMFIDKVYEAMSYILEDRERAVELFEEMRGQWVGGNASGPMMRELNIALGHSQEPTKMLVELAAIMARIKSAETRIQVNQQFNQNEPLDQTLIIEQVDKLLEEKGKK